MSVRDPKCPAHDAFQPCGECLRLAGQTFVGNPPIVSVQGPERLAAKIRSQPLTCRYCGRIIWTRVWVHRCPAWRREP